MAIDGSKIEAVASRKKVLTPALLAKRAAALDAKIAEYLAAMDEADRQEAATEAGPADVARALAVLRAKRDAVQAQTEALSEAGLNQTMTSEPDARLMKTARHGHQVAYNAQSAVDGRHGLIAAFDLTRDCNDQTQLLPMAVAAQESLAVKTLTVVADTGYSNGTQGQACAEAGITAVVPRQTIVNSQSADLFSRDAFTYDPARDCWTCPAGETLTLVSVSRIEQKNTYATPACAACAIKAQCTRGKRRKVTPTLPRRRPRGHAPPRRRGSRLDAAPPRTGRAPLRHHQMDDGLSPLPAPRPAQGQGRTRPHGSRLQSQANHHHPRRTLLLAALQPAPAGP